VTGNTPGPDGIAVHVPPKYNIAGRRQLWFVESGSKYDDFVNGMLTAAVVVGPLALLASF